MSWYKTAYSSADFAFKVIKSDVSVSFSPLVKCSFSILSDPIEMNIRAGVMNRYPPLKLLYPFLLIGNY